VETQLECWGHLPDTFENFQNEILIGISLIEILFTNLKRILIGGTWTLMTGMAWEMHHS